MEKENLMGVALLYENCGRNRTCDTIDKPNK
jgi:hypothetical protein